MTTPAAPEPNSPPRPTFFGLGAKLVLGFTLVFTLVFLGVFYWFYVFSTERAVNRIEADMRDTVVGAAEGLDGALLTRAFQVGTTDGADAGRADPAYAAQLAWLATVQELEPRAWPYTYVRGSEENQIVALVDLWIESDPAKAYSFLEEDYSIGPLIQGLEDTRVYVPEVSRCEAAAETIEGQALAALQGALRATACRVLRRVGYTDDYGKWVSAYSPVRDDDGVIVGALGLDFEMSYVDEVQDAILARTGRAFLIVYLVLFPLVLLAARVLTRPIVRLTAAARQVGDGNYDVDFASLEQHRFQDQIGVLADVLKSMTEMVDKRERTLRNEVMELKIEIDEAKRSEQVKEIVDSDFFRDLQAKAAEQRARRRGGPNPSTGTT